MLGALASGEALEIVVLLKDMSEQGFKKLEHNIGSAEHRANSANFSGFGSKSKTLAKDAEKAAGKSSGGGGGVGNLIGSFIGLPGPIAIAAAAIAGFAALSAAAVPTYEKVEQQEKALAIAAKDHGIELSHLDRFVESSIKSGEQYAFNADETRAAIIKLTEAGMSLGEQQTALPHIMDLARAKNRDLAETAQMYELALMGNTRAVKDLGIALPKLTDTEKVHQKATSDVAKASAGLKSAQDHLATVEASLQGKHKLTAAEALRLKQAHDKVHEASVKLHEAQKKLNAVQGTAAQRAARLKTLNDDLHTAVGGQAGSVTDLQKQQTHLNDVWEKFATKVGPVLVGALTDLVGVISWFVDRLSDLVDLLGKIKLPDLGQANPGNSAIHVTGSSTPFAHHAAGGWVGINGPELTWVGEKGPEYITPAGAAPSPGGGDITIHTHLIVDGRELANVVEKHLGRNLAARSTFAGSFGTA